MGKILAEPELSLKFTALYAKDMHGKCPVMPALSMVLCLQYIYYLNLHYKDIPKTNVRGVLGHYHTFTNLSH